MIIKFKTSKTPRYKQLLEYLTKDLSKIENDHGEALIIKQHLYGADIKAMTREFYENEKNRLHHRANNVKVNHEIVSFSDLDKSKITVDILKDLTQEYLRQRSPYMQAIAVGHFDTEHMHVHVMSSPIELITGKNLRMSKSDFAQLKIHMQRYQLEKYPELSKSVVRHGKKESERATGKKSREFKEDNIKSHQKKSSKSIIKGLIENCLMLAESKENFFELLKTEGLEPYKRGADWKGVSVNDKNYRFSTLVSEYSNIYDRLDDGKSRASEHEITRELNNDIGHNI